MSVLGSPLNKCIYLLTGLLCTVMFLGGEVAAKNFALDVGHLGRREPVVQPATSQAKEAAHEAHLFGPGTDGGHGGDDGG
jgi:hypothetical protein